MRWTLLLLISYCGAEHNHLSSSFLGFSESEHVKEHNEFIGSYSITGNEVLLASPAVFDVDSGPVNITVSWSNIDKPSKSDWIAMYCGADAGASPLNVLDWSYISVLSSSGSMEFPNVINMRCEYFFRYYRDVSFRQYELIVESNMVTPKGGVFVPMHVRISVTGVNDAMQVTWTSKSQTQSEQCVRYTESPSDQCDEIDLNNWDFVVANYSAPTTYNADDMCDSPANTTGQRRYRDVGYFHSVILPSLSPSTFYCYQVGNTVDGFSEVKVFRSNPKVARDVGVSFVGFGDMGITYVGPSYYDAANTMARVLDGIDDHNFLLHFGDISYARGMGFVWEQFHLMIEPVAQRIPYMISVGNHEYDHENGGENDPSGAPGNGFHPSWGNYRSDSHGECSVPLYNRFHVPNTGHSIYWYSFDYGNVHVIQISSEHDYTTGSDQYLWLEENLKSVNRAVTPFIVLTTHRPMYNSENYQADYNVTLHIRSSLEGLTDKYQVDLVLAGHYHSYERTCKVSHEVCYDDMLDPTGTVHITIGSAGASLDSAKWLGMPWHIYGAYEFGYVRIRTTESNMLLQYLLNKDGSVADEVNIPSRFNG